MYPAVTTRPNLAYTIQHLSQLFVPTVIAVLHPSNRLWAPVCPDLLWRSQAASVDGKDLTGLSICWGLK